MSRKKAPSGTPGGSDALKGLSAEMQDCHGILKFFQGKPEASAFLEPVDWKGFNLPDYPEIIKTPMDLGTVESKLMSGKYKTADQFVADMRLIFRNAMTYNRSDSDIYGAADNLMKQFEKKAAKLKKGGAPAVAGAAAAPGQPPKRKRDPTKSESREVTRQDRVKFSQLVQQLTSDQLGQLVSLLQKSCPDALNEEDGDELEIEINNIDGTTLLQCNAYANDCIVNNGNAKKKKAR